MRAITALRSTLAARDTSRTPRCNLSYNRVGKDLPRFAFFRGDG